jgi:hypothetical protein
MSYIVKNCPAYEYDEEWDYHICKRNLAVYETTCDTCPECSDCTTKQIVELCKNKDYFVKRFPNSEFSSGVQNSELAFDILKLLDIQEQTNEK